MNPKGFDFSGSVRFSKKQFLSALFLAMLCALITGCPHNDYTVELKPTASGIERTLTFYRVDDGNSNGVLNYQEFPSNELAAITRVYPSGAVKQDGKRHVAKGEFAGLMPNDVGGVGTYTNFVTSLGGTGFYLERFRGDDDMADRVQKQFHAADRITDLVTGWTQTEFGRERGYKKLHKFLDEDFRRDLKNAGQYFQLGALANLSNTNTPEEFAARFIHYLFERGYLKLSDAPVWYRIVENGGDDSAVAHLLKQLAAEKMGIQAGEQLPKSFAILGDSTAMEKSWKKYLARTDLYRAKVKEWERKRKTEPKLEQPKPFDVMNDLFAELLGGEWGGEPDHLTVKLALNRAPNHTNGKWQNGHVVWEASLEENRALPAFCFASWSSPDAQFQKAHFGRVLLDGDELTQYCLWQSGLGGEQIHEWETFLTGLLPGEELKKNFEDFHFTAEPALPAVNDKPSQFAIGRKLLIDAFGKEPGSK
jgi:hypothetical protein